MNEYKINSNTIALVPIEKGWTKIIEENDIFLVNKNTMNIVEDSCRFFGSSYLGRHDGTKMLLGVSYKSPIIIEESNNLIYFPTTSPRLKECIWLSLKHIKDYNDFNGKTIILFENNQNLVVNISYESFNNQYLRATKLDLILRKRKI